MKKFFISIYNTASEFFERFFVVITLIVGFVCLYYGITNELGNPDLKRFFHTVGSLALASGIFAGIAKSNQFTEIYKKIFREIIYCKEHLDNRKDLEKIWENITEALINQKFKNINGNMKDNIKKYYLPMNHDYYLDDMNCDITVEFSDKNPDYVIVNEITCYTIICEDEDLKIDNRFVAKIKIDGANHQLTTYDLLEYYIDDTRVITSVNRKYDGNWLTIEYNKELKGKKKYKIKRVERKHYSLNYNSIRRHLAVWLYNDCTINITFPKDLYVEFQPMGVLNTFSSENRSNNQYNRFIHTYKGLIYKNQGFFFHLRKK